MSRRSLLALLVLAVGGAVAWAVLSPAPVAPPDAERPSDRLTLRDASFQVDGETETLGDLDLHPFQFAEIVTPRGTVVLSPAPFGGAERVGAFDGNRVDVDVDGVRVVLTGSVPLLPTGDRPAYALLDRDQRGSDTFFMWARNDSIFGQESSVTLD